MAIFAELNGQRIRTATVTLPYHGIWHADVVLDQPQELTGPLTLVLGDLTLVGTVFRQGGFTGVNYVRIIGGAGGWMKQIPAKEYVSSFGVKFSVIAGDAAREAGEKISIATDFSVGNSYERQTASASRVLDTFAPLWWMRSDGVTVLGPRPTTKITSRFDVMLDGTNLSVGKITVATDNPAAWQPAAVFSSPVLSERTASAVVHRLSASKLRTEIWTL